MFLLWVSLHALPTMLAKLIIPRTAIAIYLGLLGDGMSQFTFVMARSNEANECPWQIPGRDYISSCQLKNERDGDAEMEDVNRKFKRRRNNGTSDGEE